jgi:hypothetical protein
MFRRLLAGMAAGAAGTAALNTTTYLDITVRGRPPSKVPEEVAGKLLGMAGVELDGTQGEGNQEEAKNRKSGAGALTGYMAGVGTGWLYGLIRTIIPDMPLPIGAVLLTAGAMAAGDAPAVALGVTDPSNWGTSGWLADIIPHFMYGLVAAATYEACRPRRKVEIELK